MKHITRLMTYLLLILGLSACISKPEKSNSPSVPNVTIEFEGFTITAPEYAFLNEPFEYSITDNQGTITQQGELGHHSGFAPSGCCEQSVFYDSKLYSFHVPTYSNVIDVGPPITIKANRDQVIGLDLNFNFLTVYADAVKSIRWQHTSGATAFAESSDHKQLSFTTPNVNAIERWVFKATVNTEQGRIFTQEKIVFVVPESAWLDVQQVYVGNGNDVVALRSDTTLYASENLNNHFFITAPTSSILSIAKSAHGIIYVASEQGDLFMRYLLSPEWLKVDKNLGRITSMIDAASARNTVIMINDEGDVFDTLGDFKLRAQGAVSIAPELFKNVYLTPAGTILDAGDSYAPENNILFNNIKKMHSMAFLSNEGKVGTLFGPPDLTVFDPYIDYTFVTSTKETNDFNISYNYHIFALRAEGRVISTSRLPPDLRNIKSITSGTGIHAALAEDGTVYRWGLQRRPNEIGSAYGWTLGVEDDVLSGLLPNPANLTERAFEAYRVLVQ